MLAALSCFAAATAFTSGAGGAVDLTSVYSTRMAAAVFAHQYGTVWGYIEPGYRSQVKRSVWQRCVAHQLAQSRNVKIKRISVSGTRRLQSTLPLLGKVTLIDVSLQVLYTLPGEKSLNAGLLYAYWVKTKGKWYAVWLPTQYDAYKAGKCAQPGLY